MTTLTDKVLQIDDFLITTIITDPRWKENCYLVQHRPSSEQILIDPGDRADIIAPAILKGSGRLRHILLTHAHFDHCGAAAVLTQQFILPCRLHKNDLRQLYHAPMYALRFAGKSIESPISYQTLDQGQPLQFGEHIIGVIHTPGHTSGSVCYQIGKIVFTGDTLLCERVGRTDLPGSDAMLLASSVSCLLEVLAGETILLAGHGSVWTIGEANVWWRKNATKPQAYNYFES